MKNTVQTFMILITSLCCLVVLAESKAPKKVTLPSGRVLEEPFILGQNPEGLEVGHKGGILFIRFEEMPKEIQKKYNYDPAKAKEYRKKKAKRKRKHQEQQQRKLSQEKANREKYNKILDNAHLDKLEMDIKKCELRIKFLKEEIPKLEGNNNNFLNKATSLAGKSVSGRGGGSYYSWGGGYYSSNNPSGQRAETTKRKVISGLSEGYTKNKSKLKRYKDELNRKETELISIKRQYERLRSKQSSSKK